MAEWDSDDGPRRPLNELRRIARYQRWLIATLLAEVGLWVGFLALSWLGLGRGGGGSHTLFFPVVITLLLGCFGGVYAFLISWMIRGPFSAFIMGVGTMIPCMGIIVLTVVNGIATTELTANGVAVGMFGADIDAISAEKRLYDDEDAGW